MNQNAKLERMPKCLRSGQNFRKKTKKMKLCRALLRPTFQHSTIQNKDHVRFALTESTHDCSNDKNCDWFEQVNAEENALGSNKTTKENRKRH